MLAQSLENHACILKGFILTVTSPPVPDAVMKSLEAVLAKARQSATAPLPSVDESMAAYDRVMEQRAARAPEDAKVTRCNSTGTPVSTIFAAPAPTERTEAPARWKRARHTILSEADLPAVQEAHDRGESNGSIAARKDVSDQTIINFLKRYGNYQPKHGAGGRPSVKGASQPIKLPAPAERTPAPLYPPREDMLGEPMTIGAAAPAPRAPSPYKKGNLLADKYDGMLQPGDLMDIHDMLAAGKDTQQIGNHFNTSKENIEDFILSNPSAQMTRVIHTPPAPMRNASAMNIPESKPIKRRRKPK